MTFWHENSQNYWHELFIMRELYKSIGFMVKTTKF